MESLLPYQTLLLLLITGENLALLDIVVEPSPHQHSHQYG
jgi:hypothetical protein